MSLSLRLEQTIALSCSLMCGTMDLGPRRARIRITPRDGSRLHGVVAPIAISPFVSEVGLQGHHWQAHERCSCTSGTESCVHAWHVQAALGDTSPLPSIAEAMIHVGSLATICSSVRMFTETLLDMVVVTIDRNFCWRSLGSTPSLVMLQLRGLRSNGGAGSQCKASKSQD